MPPPSDWLSWEFWAQDSQGLYHLALIVAGAIGVPLLAIRTFAANRSANASLKQAEAANRSAKAALEQAKTAADRHEKQTSADRERRITESFAKAIEQLGSDNLETSLGGIYTLERIVQESEREYWPIMETLTAYVRVHAPWLQAGETPGESTVRLAADIQAVLTVLGRCKRRDENARKQDQTAGRHLLLTETDLRGAILCEAHLEDVFLYDAHFEDAILLRAHLKGVDLWGTHLERARLSGAHLEGADLSGAHIEGANLQDANGLTQEQVNCTNGDEKTTLPAGLTPPARWSEAKPDAAAG